MRLAEGGTRIDRATPLRFTFDGVELPGFAGDTLAGALLAGYPGDRYGARNCLRLIAAMYLLSALGSFEAPTRGLFVAALVGPVVDAAAVVLDPAVGDGGLGPLLLDPVVLPGISVESAQSVARSVDALARAMAEQAERTENEQGDTVRSFPAEYFARPEQDRERCRRQDDRA